MTLLRCEFRIAWRENLLEFVFLRFRRKRSLENGLHPTELRGLGSGVRVISERQPVRA